VPLGISTNPDGGPVPIKVPPLGPASPTASPPSDPGQPRTPTTQPAPPNTTPPSATTPGADKADPETNSNHHHDHRDGDGDGAPTTSGPPPDTGNALNGLASLAPQLASPLIGAATGLPAAALQGAGTLIPSLAAAILPQLQALANQLGTGYPPGSPASHIATSGADNLAGTLAALAGHGPAADRARAQSQALQQRVNALHDVEHQVGDILGLSSARTQSDRAKIEGVIDDVESALISAGTQGDTPQAQAAVLAAMRKGLDEAGDVVTAAARAKLADAEFIRNLIHNFLATAGGPDSLQAAAASGAGTAAARIAHDALGTPYVWGGGGPLGPTKGGFDCSGLTQWAIARATGGHVILPRTTYDQIRAGTQVPLNALVPGDLVFSNFSAPGVPEHVAIYIGNGQVIEAPTPGVPVRIGHIPSEVQARRVA
jgi:cell wall-associated NlpC family hydrolase